VAAFPTVGAAEADSSRPGQFFNSRQPHVGGDYVGGHGDPAKMATAILQALQSSKTPLAPPAAPASQPAIDLDTAQLDQIIGVKGQPT
jgi:hypothetical protein